MGAISWGFGFYLFNWANNCEVEYKQDMASIEAGEFTEHEYSVTRKYVQRSKDSSDSYMVLLSGPDEVSRDVGSQMYPGISVGNTYAAKHVNGRVRIPEIDGDAGNGNAKWFFLGLGGFIGLFPIGMGTYEIVQMNQ